MKLKPTLAPAAPSSTNRRKITMRELLTHEKLLGPIYGRESFEKQVAILCAFASEELTDKERKIMHKLSGGRTMTPGEVFNALCMILGRRSDKTQMSGVLSISTTVCSDYSDLVSPGERPTALILANDKKQGGNCMRYIQGMIDSSRILAQEVLRSTDEMILFKNGTAIVVATASFRSARGFTLCCVICDEVAFWLDDGRNPDVEIINAVRPGLATTGGPLVLLSSPHARRGVLWDAYRRHYGNDGSSTLVVQAPTWEMNPTLPQSLYDEAFEEDPDRAKAEYGAEFRNDLEQFVQVETVDACTRSDHLVIPAARGIRYVAFVDPSGGSADSMTLAIAHHDHQSDRIIVDHVVEKKPPFSPQLVAEEFAAVLHAYSVSVVNGDAYGGMWPREQFTKRRVRYELSDRNKTQLYQEFLPLLNSGRVELPPNPVLRRQLLALERRTTRGGRELIDHAPGAHDDVVNAVAGVCAFAAKPKPAMEMKITMAF
ncbi:hypothetical protein R0137_09730 [Congregibacter brevis]|uniref:Terminase large subunit n=1 Tax=Congregibacter brevis TaxID=3081201 RepID=A0ABZ0I9S5_9GAMM|nr:hypothetical protein R0137_09730 [Congregibacter sp. IMCC45268]